MATPDVTKAQLLALVQAAIATAVSLGAPISSTAQDKVMGLSAIIAAAIVAADVAIRRGRQKHLGAGTIARSAVDAILTELENAEASRSAAATTETIKPASSQLDAITAEVPPEQAETGGDDPPANPPSAL